MCHLTPLIERGDIVTGAVQVPAVVPARGAFQPVVGAHRIDGALVERAAQVGAPVAHGDAGQLQQRLVGTRIALDHLGQAVDDRRVIPLHHHHRLAGGTVLVEIELGGLRQDLGERARGQHTEQAREVGT